jgi:hypothetical protein
LRNFNTDAIKASLADFLSRPLNSGDPMLYHKLPCLPQLLFTLIPLFGFLTPATVQAKYIEFAPDGVGTMQYKLTGTVTANLVTSPVRAGTHAHQLTVTGAPRRAEIDAGTFSDPRGAYWYKFSYYIPDDAGWSGNFWQFMAQWRFSNQKAPGFSAPNVAMGNKIGSVLHGGSGQHLLIKNGRWMFNLVYQDPGARSSEGLEGRDFDLAPVTKNAWTDFVIEGKWTHLAEHGSLKIWMRVGSGPFTKVAEYFGPTWVDTFAVGSQLAGQPVPAPNFTVGLYASDSNTVTRTAYVDEIYTSNLMGASGFAEVMPNGGAFDYGATNTINGAIRTIEAETPYIKRFTSGPPINIVTDVAASGGSHVVLGATSNSGLLRADIAILQGNYNLKVRFKKGPNQGRFQLSINNNNIGGIVDQYSASPTYEEVDFGTINIATDSFPQFKFTVSNKNAASSSFNLSVDRIILTNNSYVPTPGPVDPLNGEVYEAEDGYYPKFTSGPAFNILTDAAASFSKYVQLESTSAGPALRVDLIHVHAGEQRMKVRYRTGPDLGRVQVQVDNVNQGTVIDQYSATPGYQIADLGTINFPAFGPRQIKFITQAKNAASSGHKINVDWINFEGASAVPTTDLRGYWRFEQNADDASGNNNHGTPRTGFGYSTDFKESTRSGDFDGAGGRVFVPHSSSLLITNNLTLAAWVKPTSTTSNANILSKSDNTGYRLRLINTGKLNLILGNGTASPLSLTSDGYIPAGTWSHVAATVTLGGGTATVRFYINGALNSTKTGSLTAIQGGTGALIIGARLDSTAEPFWGLVDKALIYARAVPPAEISLLQ